MHALAGVALVLLAFYAVVASGDAPSEVPPLLGGAVGGVGLPLLILGTVSALSHGPRWVHGFGLAAATWAAAAAIVIALGGPAAVTVHASGLLPSWVWVPVVVLPPVLLVTAAAGLVLRRRRCAAERLDSSE